MGIDRDHQYECQTKAIWLASYPKSGNTWMRAFFTVLLERSRDSSSTLEELDGWIYPNAESWSVITSLDHKMLSPETVHHYHRQVIEVMIGDCSDGPRVIKTHSPYIPLSRAIPTDGSHRVLLIVRNPLAVVGSMAHFANITITESLNRIIAPPADHNDHAFEDPLRLGSWSAYIDGWRSGYDGPMMIVRYEDMVGEPRSTFSQIVRFLDLPYGQIEIDKAIEMTRFDRLRSLEQGTGFREKPYREKDFFRKGKTDSWKEELSPDQVQLCINHHREMMQQLGYL